MDVQYKCIVIWNIKKMHRNYTEKMKRNVLLFYFPNKYMWKPAMHVCFVDCTEMLQQSKVIILFHIDIPDIFYLYCILIRC